MLFSWDSVGATVQEEFLLMLFLSVQMDGEADGASPREEQNSCVNFLMEVKDLEERSSKSSHKVDQFNMICQLQ